MAELPSLPAVVIERVAVALWSHGETPPERCRGEWANEDEDVREYWRGQARVALVAALTGADLEQEWVITVEHTDGHNEIPVESRQVAVQELVQLAKDGGRGRVSQRWTVTFDQPVMRAHPPK